MSGELRLGWAGSGTLVRAVSVIWGCALLKRHQIQASLVARMPYALRLIRTRQDGSHQAPRRGGGGSHSHGSAGGGAVCKRPLEATFLGSEAFVDWAARASTCCKCPVSIVHVLSGRQPQQDQGDLTLEPQQVQVILVASGEAREG
jgi:hypothetical protein